MKAFQSVEKRVALLFDINDFETNQYWINFVRYLVVGIAFLIENFEELNDQELKTKIKNYIIKDKFTEKMADDVYFRIAKDFNISNGLYELFHSNLEEKTKLLNDIREFLTCEDEDDLIERKSKLLEMNEYKKEYKNIKFKKNVGIEKFEIVEKIIALLYGFDNYETNPHWIMYVRYLVVGIALSIENFEELSDQELKNEIEDYIVNDKFSEKMAEQIYHEMEEDFETNEKFYWLFHSNLEGKTKKLNDIREFLTCEDEDDLIEKNSKLLEMNEYKKEYKNIKFKKNVGIEKFEIVEKIIALLYGFDNYETNPHWIMYVRYLVVGIALSIENFEELSDQELKNEIEDYIVNDKFSEKMAEQIYHEMEDDFNIIKLNARRALSSFFLNKAKDRKKILKSVEEFLLG